ncbi:MAG: LysR substrate-binding domain-containing protein, partial [Marinomonas sp.]
TWLLSEGEQSYKVKPKASYAANDGDLVRRWCAAGKGVAIKSCLDVANDLLDGRIVPLMSEYDIPQGELWLVCPSRQSITPIVRLLRDLFRDKTRTLLLALVEKGLLDKRVLDD